MTVVQRSIVDSSNSPHAVLDAVPPSAVRLAAGFWRDRLEANRSAGLPALLDRLEAHGAVDNFRRLAGHAAPRRGLHFADSDVYKWVEAAAWSLGNESDPELEKRLSDVVDAIAAAQDDDGYLHTAHRDDRYRRLGESHELYCGGHLIQAGIALARSTGDERLLAVARRYADHLVGEFGRPRGRQGFDGHPEIELALIELARATTNDRYAALAADLLSRTQHESLRAFTGHAVRTAYLCCGLADLVAETGNATARETLDRLWASVVSTRLYVTGGLGSRWSGETVGRAYELPTQRAYAETCASVGLVMWATRMLTLQPDADYADVVELALYNGALAGMSLDGAAWSYTNPLASDGEPEQDPWSDAGELRALGERPAPARSAWHDCTCCPPNIARLLASMPGLMYAVDRTGDLWVHLYAASRMRAAGWDISQETSYPWDGTVRLRVHAAGGNGRLRLRVPSWARSGATIDGEANGVVAGSYVELPRSLSVDDVVTLVLPMPVSLVTGHPRAAEARGACAVRRGPLVYCLEEVDNPGVDLLSAGLRSDAADSAISLPAQGLDGITAIQLPGWSVASDQPLYRDVADKPHQRPVTLTAVPYYCWGNRGVGAMTVWVRLT